MACASLLVSAAGISAARGVYNIGAPDPGSLFTFFHTQNNYKITGSSQGSGNIIVWTLRATAGGPPLYSSDAEQNCPAGLTLAPVVGTAPGAIVTLNTPPGPNCADPLERCAFAVAGESGRSRFRRLVALGYV